MTRPYASAPVDLNFGSYTAARLLGQGAMGVVYEARNPARAGHFAVKAMHGSLTGDAVAIGRFLREAQTMVEVTHPHVVRIEDSGIQDGRPYIVMEYIEGETMASWLDKAGRLSPPQLTALFLPMLSAVAALHNRRIVHRDLKPANVMLRRGDSDQPVLLDFGISRIDEASKGNIDLTRSEVLLGTLQYLSPEQLRSAKWAGPQSDQYALGIMMYQCLTGRHPFHGESHYELMHAIVTAPVVPPSRQAPGLSADFDAVVLRAMNRDPARRFPGVRALGSALLSFADKATWGRWGAEFTGADREPDIQLLPPTERDAPRSSPVVAVNEPAPARRGVGRTRMAIGFVAGLAISAGVAFFVRNQADPVPAALPAVVAPLSAAPAPPAEAPPAAAPVEAPAAVAPPPPPPSVAETRVRPPKKPPRKTQQASIPTKPSPPANELGDDDVFDPFPRSR